MVAKAINTVSTLLNGSAWSTDKKYMMRYKESFDNFFGMEHRMRKEEMEEQFNKETKQGWRFAANAARIIDDNAGSKDCNYTSGAVSVAIHIELGAVVDKEEGAARSTPGNEGRIAQAWVSVRGGMWVFAVYFWHSEGRTPRNEALTDAVVRQARTTGHPWLMACDANIGP